MLWPTLLLWTFILSCIVLHFFFYFLRFTIFVFLSDAGWVRLRLQEWKHDYEVASKKLSDLNFVNGSADGRSNADKNKTKENIKQLQKLMKKLTSIIDRYSTLADTYWVLHKSAAHCDPRGWQPLTFKASTKKGDRELAFVPTNLHTQLFSMNEGK
tara:strand:- start:132 stop:599 length:468 start_codon:yes stop_codon:yes gene_type:complete